VLIPERLTSYSITVRFQVILGDYAVSTHAASVEVGENGKILGAYVNIARLKEYETVPLKSGKPLLNLLKARLSSPLAEPPEAGKSVINLRSFDKLTVTRSTLQIYERRWLSSARLCLRGQCVHYTGV